MTHPGIDGTHAIELASRRAHQLRTEAMDRAIDLLIHFTRRLFTLPAPRRQERPA